MEPKIYTSVDHHIRNHLIDPNALSVLKKLHEAGFVAYLVGGSVRDLLMNKRPKDFDISTSATPEQIKETFRNCILIGRRFRLAHIRFGRQIIEVATFRAGDPTQEDLIVRDNIWGSPEEDVLRRDFTLNGLFYDPLDHRIIDYVGGYEDLKTHTLSSIGDPALRFKQDPVRMIRLQKFVARFGFKVDEATQAALETWKGEIVKSSQARVLEEIFRMLESGASRDFFSLLYESGLLSILFPKLTDYFEGGLKEEILLSLKMADEMNYRGHYQPLDRSILVAALLYPVVEHEIQKRYPPSAKLPHMGEIMGCVNELIHEIWHEAFVHFPKKIRFEAHQILQMQYRLIPLDRHRRTSLKILRQKGVFLAIVFLKLRALKEPSLFKIYEHWKRVYKQSQEREGEESHGA